MKSLLIALAIVSTSPTHAQTDREAVPVVVEVIGTGAVDVRASAISLPISYSGKGATMTAAEAAMARKEAEVLKLLAAERVPATAITPLSTADRAKISMAGMLTGLGSGMSSGGGSEAEEAGAATEEAAGGRTVRVTTYAQASALTAKLKAAGVLIGEPILSFDNVAASRRDARLAALKDARVGAERYAAALGMKVGPVRRVSESGSGPMLPGLQEKLSAMLATGGPGLMQQMMQPTREVRKIEESVVAEFALLP